MWRDRFEAGSELADRLAEGGYAGRADVVVLGVPRGGVEVARVVADRLDAPLDIVVVRKIGAPGNPEFAAGAVDVDGTVHANPMARVDPSWLERAAVPEQAEAQRRLAEYRTGMGPLDLTGKTAIVVDDGIATGLTALAALRWLKGRGASRTVLATPVMPPDSLRTLGHEADEVVVLQTPAWFSAVGEFYASFPQLSDADVMRLLQDTSRM
jgi:predicted phosphoribosyltransferase